MKPLSLNRNAIIAVLCFVGIAVMIGAGLYQSESTRAERQADMEVLMKASSRKDTNCAACKLPKRSNTEMRTTSTEQLVRSAIKTSSAKQNSR